jgi:2-polyprenyl-6-methoxyphenol hydroxylase-like FAD-dependent oxidoreductase
VEHAVVIGGGIGGLATALALGRAGHRVTLLERDVLPTVDDPDAAFAAERQGAPQVHQTHGFLARLQVTLRDRFPDVFADLLNAGCSTMSTTANLGDPQPGDEDLKVIIVRRTTLEWVLRRAALAQPGIELRSGNGVAGLVADVTGNIPRVTGVRLEDGTTVAADLVIAANGRRSAMPEWLATLGVEVPEKVRESGLMYVTRWYRLPDDRPIELDPKLGGDLGFVKYLAVPGDGGTLSVTLAIRSDDHDLRNALASDDRFDLACRNLPGPDRFFVGAPLQPIGGVRPMGGLLNRVREFVDAGGRPTVLGFHVVGDAHTCTNPLYGRGCALAVLQAVLLADALAEHPRDPVGRSAAYEAACTREVAPWYDVSVQMDRLGADPTGIAGSEEGNAMARVFVAAQTDPVIGRAIVKFWNLMVTPADLATDAELLARTAAVMADPDSYPIPPREGPTRDELLAKLEEEDTAWQNA